ncbi:MAG: hypothetical protein QN173_01830 [Armatimonadota bacterium]|nr:hypothetical protein [Armatimonadota bacterium]MDR7401356.1 hypothetical protein [Armatimonadota bacterium]MDR7437465.1 hypothetical protein [Armatimonadota bacterium]MDR7472370.1 hypothetical protein [Armatimonadota bacterium]MDR7506327.1 hypothetical protein [Armatimonadota bacterium]
MQNLPDLSQIDWAKLLSVSFTLAPAVYKYRGVLARVTDVLAEAVGLAALGGGVYVYTRTLPQIQQAVAQLAADPGLITAERLQTLDQLYFGSVGLMGLGGMLAVFGLIGRIGASLAGHRNRAGAPPRRK